MVAAGAVVATQLISERTAGASASRKGMRFQRKEEEVTANKANETEPTGPGRWVVDPDDPECEVWEAAPKEAADDRPDDDLSWQDGRQPARACSAHRTNGKPCRKAAINGGTVCATHGGRAPQVKRAARARLENAADRMAKELLKIAVSDDAPDSVKLSAIKDALDRAGLSAKTAVEVEVGPNKRFEEVLGAMMAGGSRSESRSRRGEVDDADSDQDWIDDEIELAEIVPEDDAPRPRLTPTPEPARELGVAQGDGPTEAAKDKDAGFLDLEEALTELRRTPDPGRAPQAPAAPRRHGRGRR